MNQHFPVNQVILYCIPSLTPYFDLDLRIFINLMMKLLFISRNKLNF